MFCKNCGREQLAGERFCAKCGTEYEFAAQKEDSLNDGLDKVEPKVAASTPPTVSVKKNSHSEGSWGRLMAWLLTLSVLSGIVWVFKEYIIEKKPKQEVTVEDSIKAIPVDLGFTDKKSYEIPDRSSELDDLYVEFDKTERKLKIYYETWVQQVKFGDAPAAFGYVDMKSYRDHMQECLDQMRSIDNTNWRVKDASSRMTTASNVVENVKNYLGY